MEEVLKKIFRGFQTPKYTQIPDEIMDLLLPILSGAELKVLLYICRRTFGFKKDSDAISLSQIANGITKRNGEVLDSGTGLSKRHVQRAIKRLEELNTVRVIRKLDEDGINEVNVYTLNFLDQGVGTKSPYGRDMDVTRVGTPVSPTINSKQELNVNVELIKNKEKNDDDNDGNDEWMEQNLLQQVIEFTGDINKKSVGTYLKIIRKLGSGTFDHIMSITKDAARTQNLPRNKRAGYFMGVAKNIATERGIDLGFKNNSNRKIPINLEELKAKIGNSDAMRRMKSPAE
jgi:phage replication O-like protein O